MIRVWTETWFRNEEEATERGPKGEFPRAWIVRFVTGSDMLPADSTMAGVEYLMGTVLMEPESGEVHHSVDEAIVAEVVRRQTWKESNMDGKLKAEVADVKV
jgi:hypothetical protein